MKYCQAFIIFIIILTSSCRSGNKGNDCKYGKPTEIFNTNTPGIQQHNFKTQNNEAREEVVFTDGLALTLLQSGCNEIRQEFQFNLNGDLRNQAPEFWINEAVRLLKRLGNMGFNYNGFTQWAQLIEAQQGNIKLAESIELQAGFTSQLTEL
ncbi:MAG: hypothetical protein ACK4ON_12320 [Bacteroidia bacterium]